MKPSFALGTFVALCIAAVACGGSSGQQTVAPTEEPAAPLVVRPGATLLASAEKFTTEVTSFEGAFTATFELGDSSFSAKGEMAFEAPDKMSMKMSLFGLSFEMLAYGADFYIRLPGGDWAVIAGESLGIDKEALAEYVENRGVIDYAGITELLEDVTQLPDETIDGRTYSHYTGILNFEALLDELPEGIFDAATLQQATDSIEPASFEVWLDKETSLPRKMDMVMTMDVDEFSSTIEIAMDFLKFNEPVSIPEPPEDAKPFEGLDPEG